MCAMMAFERFTNSLIKCADGVVSPLDEIGDKKLVKNLENTFWGFHGLYRTAKQPDSPKSHKAFTEVYYRFIEVYDTTRVLHEISKYTKKEPYWAKEFSSVQKLRHYAQSYASEVYVLRDRLLKFLICLEKVTPHSQKDDNFIVRIAGARDVTKKELHMHCGIRNNLIHEHRVTSAEIHKLLALEVIAKDQNNKETKLTFRREFNKERQAWIEHFERNNMRIESALNCYFVLIDPVIFSDRGKFLLCKLP
jgi:hypothetical protein